MKRAEFNIKNFFILNNLLCVFFINNELPSQKTRKKEDMEIRVNKDKTPAKKSNLP